MQHSITAAIRVERKHRAVVARPAKTCGSVQHVAGDDQSRVRTASVPVRNPAKGVQHLEIRAPGADGIYGPKIAGVGPSGECHAVEHVAGQDQGANRTSAICICLKLMQQLKVAVRIRRKNRACIGNSALKRRPVECVAANEQTAPGDTHYAIRAVGDCADDGKITAIGFDRIDISVISIRGSSANTAIQSAARKRQMRAKTVSAGTFREYVQDRIITAIRIHGKNHADAIRTAIGR